MPTPGVRVGRAQQPCARYRMGSCDGPVVPSDRYRQSGAYVQGEYVCTFAQMLTSLTIITNVVDWLTPHLTDPQAEPQGGRLAGVRVHAVCGEHHEVQRLARGVECHGHRASDIRGGWHTEPVAQGLLGDVDQRAESSLWCAAEDDALLPEPVISNVHCWKKYVLSSILYTGKVIPQTYRQRLKQRIKACFLRLTARVVVIRV